MIVPLADFLGLDIAPSVGAGLIAAAVVGLRGIAVTVTGSRERQRELFGEAYKAAMAWREMLYRVRRRRDGADVGHALIDRFHELQEQIDYYEGWIGSESQVMKRSYCRLVKEVKGETKEVIRAAWNEEKRREPAHDEGEADVHPDLIEARERFLTDARWHLSLWLWFLPRIGVWWRNRPAWATS